MMLALGLVIGLFVGANFGVLLMALAQMAAHADAHLCNYAAYRITADAAVTDVWATIGNFAGGVSEGGDWNIGVSGKYQNAWNFSLTYTDYFGKAKTFTETLVPGAASPRQLTFAQTLRDRAYVSFSASLTF